MNNTEKTFESQSNNRPQHAKASNSTLDSSNTLFERNNPQNNTGMASRNSDIKPENERDSPHMSSTSTSRRSSVPITPASFQNDQPHNPSSPSNEIPNNIPLYALPKELNTPLSAEQTPKESTENYASIKPDRKFLKPLPGSIAMHDATRALRKKTKLSNQNLGLESRRSLNRFKPFLFLGQMRSVASTEKRERDRERAEDLEMNEDNRIKFPPHDPVQKWWTYLTWNRLLRHMKPASAPSDSLPMDGNTSASINDRFPVYNLRNGLSINDPDDECENTMVQEVIVENDFLCDTSANPGGSNFGGRSELSSVTGFNASASRNESHGRMTDRQSDSGDSIVSNFIVNSTVYRIVVYVLWPSIHYFLRSSFRDEEKERAFQRESWFVMKPVAICAGLFYIITWVFIMSLSPAKSRSTYDWITYGGITGFLSLFPLAFVIADAPRRRPWIWQCILLLSTWGFPCFAAANIYQCGFYAPDPRNNFCRGKDFLGLMFYAIGQPTLALLTLNQWRGFQLIGILAWTLIICIAVVPQKTSWLRNLGNFLIYSSFVLLLSFIREKSDRRLFSLRDQLKISYRATQKAQVAERKASEAKKNFTSYIFHEVRVPLNTSLLAVQNLEAEGVFEHANNEQREMLDGLASSLGMMERVLDDVLSFHRFEAGRYQSTSKPFEFHKSIRSTLLSHRTVAVTAGLSLITELDERIDERYPILAGDEMRIRQILSNLVSNGIKFTRPGGSLIVRTELLHPIEPGEETADIEAMRSEFTLPSGADAMTSQAKSTAVVRVSCIDTGVGIKPSDLLTGALFSPFAQTEIGRRQGGKGSGLGLALTKSIISASKGRLGIRSQVNVGSTFWFELPLLIPPPHINPPDFDEAPNRPVPELLTSFSQTPNSFLGVSATPIVKKDYASFKSTTPGTPTSLYPTTTTASAVNFSANQESFFPDNSTPNRPQLNKSPSVKDLSVRSKRDATKPNASPLNVLVVDDDRLTRMLMTRMLGRLNLLVTTAENGKVGLDLIQESLTEDVNGLKKSSFDIIFLDNQMPILSGVEVIRNARAIGLRSFAVGISGNAIQEDQNEFLSAGLDRMLVKPVRESSIVEILELARKRHDELASGLS